MDLHLGLYKIANFLAKIKPKKIERSTENPASCLSAEISTVLPMKKELRKI